MEKYLKLQTSVFGDFNNIDLSQENMSSMYGIFLADGMMPSVSKEFDIVSQTTKNRPSFVANDNSISVLVGSNRIDIISELAVSGEILEKDDFFDRAVNFYSSLFSVFNITANRISFIQEGLIKTIGDKGLAGDEEKYLNVDNIYNKDNLFEWNANSVTLDNWEFNGKKENVNLNITIGVRRMNGIQDGRSVTVNGLVSIQDLNTVAENVSARFGIEDIVGFFEVAKCKSGEISAVMEG